MKPYFISLENGGRRKGFLTIAKNRSCARKYALSEVSVEWKVIDVVDFGIGFTVRLLPSTISKILKTKEAEQ